MCMKCLLNGTMTLDEVKAEEKECRELFDAIVRLCDGKREFVLSNALVNALVFASINLEIEPSDILLAIKHGFDICKNFEEEEIKH